jgi:glycine cleavage system H protein
LYSPAGGVVLASNEQLVENAGLVNQDPMGEGWITKLNVTNKDEISELMNIEQYEEFLKEDH